MLIATSSPRNNASPVTVPDGTQYLFQPNVAGIHVCEIFNEGHIRWLLGLSTYSVVPEEPRRAPRKSAPKAPVEADPDEE